MYSLLGYEEMIQDKVRMDAYVAALKQVIRPNSVVLEIGAGTGVMSLLACRFGAKHVYSIEPDSAICVAREFAQANNLSDRITFFQNLSTQIELREKADVIVSDLRGVLPLFTTHIDSIIHAREQHLAPGGVLIPCKDTLWVALTDAPGHKEDQGRQWDRRQLDLDLSAVNKYLANTWTKARVDSDRLLTQPVCWGTLDYRQIASPDVSGIANLTCERDGKARGLVAWFESQVLEDIGFSNAPNAPGDPRAIYGMAYFPLLQVTDVCAGDTIDVSFKATLLEQNYFWQWATQIHRGNTDDLRAEFEQSDFFAQPLSLESLQKGAETHIPTLDEEGNIDCFIMGQMRGILALGEIAAKLAAEFPDRFQSFQLALNRVAQVSKRHSR